MRRRLYQLLLALLVGYIALVLLLWWQQDRMVFPGAGRGDRPIDVPGVEVGSLPGLDGVPFRFATCVPAEPRAVLVFFVGNGEDLCSAARRAADLATHGVLVVAPEYPGYGASAGTPGKASLFAVAAAMAAHGERLAAARGLPWLVGGISLGSFCAVHVAAAGRAQRCLLCAPPTSMQAAAAHRFWWLPVGLLLRHKLDNLARAAEVRCPVLVVHGTDDAIVPLAQGEQLCAAVAGPRELLAVPGAGHNDLPLAGAGPVGARIGRFLRGS